MGSDTGGADRVSEPQARPRTSALLVHWLATAAGLAVVVVLAVLIAPPEVSATAPVRGSAASAPAPGDAVYPLDCAGAPVQVAMKAVADLDGDGRPETAAAVHCQAGGGNPPHALFVLSHGANPDEPPRIVARLDNEDERVLVTRLEVRGRVLVADVSGYSSPDVPACCPDVATSAQWEWNSGRFTLARQRDSTPA